MGSKSLIRQPVCVALATSISYARTSWSCLQNEIERLRATAPFHKLPSLTRRQHGPFSGRRLRRGRMRRQRSSTSSARWLASRRRSTLGAELGRGQNGQSTIDDSSRFPRDPVARTRTGWVPTRRHEKKGAPAESFQVPPRGRMSRRKRPPAGPWPSRRSANPRFARSTQPV